MLNTNSKNIDFPIKSIVDSFISSIIQVIFGVASIVANIILYIIVCQKQYGFVGTTGFFIIYFCVPIIITTYISRKDDTPKRHIQLTICSIVFGIIHFFLHYNLFKNYLNNELVISFLIVSSILCVIFYITKFEKASKLFQQMRNSVTNIFLSIILFQLVDLSMFLWITIPLFLPMIISSITVESKD